MSTLRIHPSDLMYLIGEKILLAETAWKAREVKELDHLQGIIAAAAARGMAHMAIAISYDDSMQDAFNKAYLEAGALLTNMSRYFKLVVVEQPDHSVKIVQANGNGHTQPTFVEAPKIEAKPRPKAKVALSDTGLKSHRDRFAVLTETDVREIRQYFTNLGHPPIWKDYVYLGEMKGCTPENIRLIYQGKTWEGVE